MLFVWEVTRSAENTKFVVVFFFFVEKRKKLGKRKVNLRRRRISSLDIHLSVVPPSLDGCCSLGMKQSYRHECFVVVTTKCRANRRKKGLVFFVGMKLISPKTNPTLPLPPPRQPISCYNFSQIQYRYDRSTTKLQQQSQDCGTIGEEVSGEGGSPSPR